MPLQQSVGTLWGGVGWGGVGWGGVGRGGAGGRSLLTVWELTMSVGENTLRGYQLAWGEAWGIEAAAERGRKGWAVLVGGVLHGSAEGMLLLLKQDPADDVGALLPRVGLVRLPGDHDGHPPLHPLPLVGGSAPCLCKGHRSYIKA